MCLAHVHLQIIFAHTGLSYTKNSTIILYCHFVHRTNYFRCHPYFTPQTLPRPPSSFYTVIRGAHIQRLGSQALPLTVEGLYCKRPNQCLASSKILTPHPLTARRVCTPPPPAFGAGEDKLAGWRGGGGQYFGRRRHCSVLYNTYVSTLCH